jgi:hypothetical protein
MTAPAANPLAAIIRASARLHWERFGVILDANLRKIERPAKNALQRRMSDEYMRCQRLGIACKMIVLKPRRAGSSTESLHLAYHRCRAQANHKAAVLVDDKNDASTKQRLKEVWKFNVDHDTFPWGHGHKASYDAFDHGSSLQWLSAQEKRAGQGGALQTLIASEAAHYNKDGIYEASLTMLALFPTLSQTDDALIIVESTPNGADGWFYDTWQDASDIAPTQDRINMLRARLAAAEHALKELDYEPLMAAHERFERNQPAPYQPRNQVTEIEKRKLAQQDVIKAIKRELQIALDTPEGQTTASGNGFIRIFAAWFEFEGNAKALTPADRLTLEAELATHDGKTASAAAYVREMREAHPHLTLEQIAWWWERCAEHGWDVGKVKQEYPTDADSCFLASGRQRFDSARMLEIKKLLPAYSCTWGHLVLQRHTESQQPPIFMRDADGDPGAWLQVWRQPKPGSSYIACVDTCTGQAHGKNPDAHAALILGRDHPGSAVYLAARIRPARDEVAEFAYQLARMALYYQAIIATEVDNSGLAIISELQHYPVNQWRRQDYVSGQTTNELGWKTTAQMREVLLSEVARRVLCHADPREGLIITCPHLWTQLWNFILLRNKWQAGGKFHDDDIFALGIGLVLIDQATPWVTPTRVNQLPPELAGKGQRGGRRTGWE